MSEYDESFEVCDDCGRQFPRSELRRCKICGHFVCPECRGTHVAKYHKSVVKSAQEPVVHMPTAAPETPAAAPAAFNIPRQEHVSPSPVNRIPVEQPRVAPSVYHAAPASSEEVVACVDCGREFPVSRMKKCNICNGAVCTFCQASHLNKKHGHFLYSDYGAPAAAANTFVPPAPAFSAPAAEKPDTSIHFKEDLEVNPIGHAAADYSYSTQAEVEMPEEVSDLMEDDTADQGDGRIKCDDCGQYFDKDELRTCKKCGHHVCPNCRTHHKCPKRQKPEKPPKEPKPPKQHKRRKHDELGDPVY